MIKQTNKTKQNTSETLPKAVNMYLPFPLTQSTETKFVSIMLMFDFPEKRNKTTIEETRMHIKEFLGLNLMKYKIVHFRD